jgi:hypothetical protein
MLLCFTPEMYDFTLIFAGFLIGTRLSGHVRHSGVKLFSAATSEFVCFFK